MMLAVVIGLAPSSAQGADRVALVIGNGSYPRALLRNPVNDVRAMSKALRQLGFEVIRLENADREAMEQGILRFTGHLTENTIGLVYYAGHGVQVKGRNYLIPVDARIDSEREVRLESVGVHTVLEELAFAGNRMNIVILDACRNNPFERRLRGQSRGLAAIDAARGTLIAYATAPGSVAEDGDGANGLYTEELLSALQVPGLEVEEVFKQVRVHVAQRTNQRQVPWESSSLVGRFVFNTAPQPASAATTSGQQAELLYWQTVTESDSGDAYRSYLERFPQGLFSDLARIRLERLETKGSSVTNAGSVAGAAEFATAAPTEQHTLLANAEPASPASAPEPVKPAKSEKPFVIGIIRPNGTDWGSTACESIVNLDSLAKDASKRVQAFDHFTFLNLWYEGAKTQSLWAKSGLRIKPIDDEVYQFASEFELDGVLALRYEIGGTYCESVQVEAILYDVMRRGTYSRKGDRSDIDPMTRELLAEFASARPNRR